MKGRDKFVLSKGMPLLCNTRRWQKRGFFPREELLTLRKLGSRLQGHPNMKKLPGIESRPARWDRASPSAWAWRWPASSITIPARIYTLLGDGELEEGIVWEAAMACAPLQAG